MIFDIQTIWFILVGALFTGYIILDGFDLGVGILHLFVKEDSERRIFLNSIGPVWDGNEVWLVTGGGALFAAFPGVYASVFSGFYNAFMLLLVALILRAVAIEFRSKESGSLWRKSWDTIFSIGSFLTSLLLGIAMGNIVTGISLNAEGDYTGSFLDLLNPYSLLLGLTVVALFTMHGAIFLVLKTEGELQNKIRGWIPRIIYIFLFLFISYNIATFFVCPNLVKSMSSRPYGFALLILDIVLSLLIPYMISLRKEFLSFLCSCLTMIGIMGVFGISYFPNLLISSSNPSYTLDIYNVSSSEKTLWNMLIIAIIGIPIVLSYTVSIYWLFRGKTRLGHVGY